MIQSFGRRHGNFARILDLMRMLQEEFAAARLVEPELPVGVRLALLNHGLGSAADSEEERVCERGLRYGFAPHPFRRDPMLQLLDDCDLAAASGESLLIQGPPGAGKEALARRLHESGPRAGRPFFAVPCSATSDALLESEVYGHVKGAFTGADRERKGWLAQAADGTVLFDEIGDASAPFQRSLLRALGSGEFFPVGSDTPVPLRARVMAATNVDLERAVAAGRFREDLYHRLSALVLRVPPLDEHREDIAHLAHGFAGEKKAVLTPEAAELLFYPPWPGNVRELRALVRIAADLFGPLIQPAGIRFLLRRRKERAPSAGSAGVAPPGSSGEGELRAALERSGWNLTETGRLLGRHRNTIRNRMKELGIAKPGRT